jgi:RND family efflux transporter MFP subunit
MNSVLKRCYQGWRPHWLAFICIPFLTACISESQEAADPPPPPQVTVAAPLQKPVVDWDEYTGRFQAVERVEIQARVDGYLDAIRFQDGQMVEKGDVLFVIDQRPFQIAFEGARADLRQAEAESKRAESEFNRFRQLVESQTVSEEEFEERRQNMIATRAQVDGAKAAVDEAKLNLEFTQVRAPISGRVSRDQVSVGNLISGGSTGATLLTTIVSVDPIHFYFEASESELLKYTRLNNSGARPGSRDKANPVYVRLLDEEEFVHEGNMDFVDNEVDQGTGTIEGRAVFENPQGIIEPGMFGRARLIGSGEYQALLVPDAAIGTDQSRKFVYVVDDENQAEMRFVQLGPLQDGDLRVIRDGLAETDRIVIGGIQQVRAGSPVNPVDGAIQEEDVAHNSDASV